MVILFHINKQSEVTINETKGVFQGNFFAGETNPSRTEDGQHLCWPSRDMFCLSLVCFISMNMFFLGFKSDSFCPRLQKPQDEQERQLQAGFVLQESLLAGLTTGMTRYQCPTKKTRCIGHKMYRNVSARFFIRNSDKKSEKFGAWKILQITCDSTKKKAYSFSHKHGSVENGCIWKAITIGDISIFTESWLLEEV